jgi:hypothetical protein
MIKSLEQDPIGRLDTDSAISEGSRCGRLPFRELNAQYGEKGVQQTEAGFLFCKLNQEAAHKVEAHPSLRVFGFFILLNGHSKKKNTGKRLWNVLVNREISVRANLPLCTGLPVQYQYVYYIGTVSTVPVPSLNCIADFYHLKRKRLLIF